MMKILSLLFIALSCNGVENSRTVASTTTPLNIDVVERTTSPSKIGLYWRDDSGKSLGNFPALFEANKGFAWACNAGMYDGTPDRQPVGLYIENGKKLRPMKKVNNDRVNFGMQPQGVFLVTKANVAKVLSVEEYNAEK